MYSFCLLKLPAIIPSKRHNLQLHPQHIQDLSEKVKINQYNK